MPIIRQQATMLKLKMEKGVHTSRSSFGGQWSKLEVVHSGQTVIYSCEW